MTIIAWDGTTLAADKRAIYGDTAIRTTTKVFKVTAIEVGILSFEGAFLGQILLRNGQTLLEVAEERELLPRLEKMA